MENYPSPTVMAVPSDVFNKKKSIILMQTAQLIKMICAISNYTMQTSREACRDPGCWKRFCPKSRVGWEDPGLVGEQMCLKRVHSQKSHRDHWQIEGLGSAWIYNVTAGRDKWGHISHGVLIALMNVLEFPQDQSETDKPATTAHTHELFGS